MLHEVDKTLTNRALEVEGILLSSGIRKEEDFSEFQLVNSALMLTSAPEVYVEIRSQAGEALWASENLAGKSIPTTSQALSAESLIENVLQPDGLKLRRFTKQIRLGEGGRVVLVLAESLTHLDAALQGSIGRTILLGFVVLTLTGILGNLAFRGIFHPLRKLVDATETVVSTGDVTRRVPVYQDSDPEIKRTAVAFNSLLERVEQLLEVAKRLLADTSHELRNPLTVLMTDLDLLKKDLTAEQRDEVISEAQSTVRRLNRLVSDLLLLSRTEAKSETLALEEVDVAKFTERVAGRFSRAQNGGGKVVVEESTDSLVAWLNRERTEQILINLFENGTRYSGQQEIRVKVYLEGDEIVISVRDKGCGIAPEEHERIFHRFYRVSHSRDRYSGGTGLGLPVARALARQQNGDIRVVSALEKGADFQVRFPRALGV